MGFTAAFYTSGKRVNGQYRQRTALGFGVFAADNMHRGVLVINTALCAKTACSARAGGKIGFSTTKI